MDMEPFRSNTCPWTSTSTRTFKIKYINQDYDIVAHPSEPGHCPMAGPGRMDHRTLRMDPGGHTSAPGPAGTQYLTYWL